MALQEQYDKVNVQLDKVLASLGLSRPELKDWQKQQQELVLCQTGRHRVPMAALHEHNRHCEPNPVPIKQG